MTVHLLLITLGPVQDFIAQARRTRDLWYGSHLLSELSRAAARALVDGRAELLFPALKEGDAELHECRKPLRETHTPPQSIANKLLAKVPASIDPKQLARTVRKAVTDYWRDQIAEQVRSECSNGLLEPNIDPVWTEQIDSFLEFAAAWLPLGDYKMTRRQLEQAIAGRKLLRDFDAWKHGRGNVPKSSLDGARETVLLPPGKRASAKVRRYRIADGEQLDAVGLVKRVGGEPDQFVPVVNVALASWLSRAGQVAPAELDALKKACREAGVSRVQRTDLPCVELFPFDGSVLLPHRWRSVFEEQGLKGDPEAWGRQHVKPLLQKLGEPYPYVACLVADGDHMGRAIDALGSADKHTKFSQELTQFAAEARQIVEQKYRGTLIYSGGDDVLAFLPLPEALVCADALRTAFKSTMATVCDSLDEKLRPTLSVGIGVGHVLESMGDLLTLGRQAEHEAKHDRNALAVIVDKRSGGTRTWCASWDTNPVATLREAALLLENRLPSRKVYEIASILRRLPEPDDTSSDSWGHVIALEVKCALSRVEGGGLRPADAGLDLDPNNAYAALYRQVVAWVDRLLIARTFLRAPIRARYSQDAAA